MLAQIIGMTCLGTILLIVIGGEIYRQNKYKKEE